MRRFPVLWQASKAERWLMTNMDCPTSIPWDLIEPHEAQAKRNHDQTLERLAERGGLSPHELLAVLRDMSWLEVADIPMPGVIEQLKIIIARFWNSK